jgi:hypothetical protein
MKPQIKFEKATRDDVVGIGRRGHLEMDYGRMVRAFGEPNDCTEEGPWYSGDHKVRREWAFKTVDNKKHTVVTLYDYKSDIPVEQIRDWHIGIKGNAKTALKFITSSLEATYSLSLTGSAVLDRPHATNEKAQNLESHNLQKIRHTRPHPRRQVADR